jgi:transglutaminase-like putative cysteine protease
MRILRQTIILVLLIFSILLEPQTSIPQEQDNELWSGIYIKGKKSGYSVSSIKKTEEGYIISEKVEMVLKVMNTYQRITTTSTINTDPNLLMDSFTYQINSAATSLSLNGWIANNNIHIKTTTGKEDIVLPFKGRPFLSANIIHYLFKRGIKENVRYKINILDPSTLSQDEMAIELVEKEKRKVGNITEDAYHLKGTYKGMNMHTWVKQDGRTIREESPLGITIVQEPRETAIREPKEDELIDIIEASAVAANVQIKEPAKVRYLKARLHGVDLKGFRMNDERQRISGDIIEVRSEDIVGAIHELPLPLPISKKGLEAYLGATPFIQSNDKEIISLAKNIIRDERDSLRAAMLINDWVYRNIQKRPTVSIPSATDVLKMRAGDCNEHTTLFVALARAVGIPARINAGMVYLGDRFFYHTWPEVYVGKWLAVDPTLNQFPADATHIRFVTGDLDKQIEMMKVINRLKIEVIEHGN